MRVFYFDIVEFIKDLVAQEQLQKRSKLKIALMTHTLFYGGVDNVVRQQADDLLEAGYNVTILALRGNLDVHDNIWLNILGCPEVYTICMIYELLFFLDIFKILKWSLKLRNFDIIICHHNSVAWIAYFVKIFNKSAIFVYQNHSPMINSPHLFPRISYRLYMSVKILICKYIISKADYVVSVSNYARKELWECIGVSSFVVYNKANLDRFRYRGYKDKKFEVKISTKSGPIILYVGRLIPQKKVDLLIKAFKLVKMKTPNAKLFIVGSGDVGYSKKIKKMCEFCSSSVIFLGYIPESKLPMYYCLCDVFATCSIWESFNLTAIEAQACGKPVVAFDIGPHREVIKVGHLVEPMNMEEFTSKLLAALDSVNSPKGKRKTAKKCLNACRPFCRGI